MSPSYPLPQSPSFFTSFDNSTEVFPQKCMSSPGGQFFHASGLTSFLFSLINPSPTFVFLFIWNSCCNPCSVRVSEAASSGFPPSGRVEPSLDFQGIPSSSFCGQRENSGRGASFRSKSSPEPGLGKGHLTLCSLHAFPLGALLQSTPVTALEERTLQLLLTGKARERWGPSGLVAHLSALSLLKEWVGRWGEEREGR